MKIAYYTEVDLDANDGPAVNELEFINSMHTLDSKDYLIFVAKPGKLMVDTNTIVLGNTPRISHLVAWWNRYKQIRNALLANNIHLVVCRLTDYPFVVLWLKLFNPKIKIAIKTAALWWMGRHGAQSVSDRIYNYLNDAMTKMVYRRADAIDVAMPETEAKLYELKLAKPDITTRIDNAINVELFTPRASIEARTKLGIPNDAIVLGFAGSLPSQRGAVQILQAAERLQSQIKNLYVLIIGNDNHLSTLIQNASFPKERIIAPGVVSYLQVPFYISAMTICYSFFETHKIKATGNASQKVKQYLAMGKPVISVATGHQYLAQHMLGAPVDQNNIEEIAQATMTWVTRVIQEGEGLVQRLHAYAVEHLSTLKTFKQRLEFWQSLQG